MSLVVTFSDWLSGNMSLTVDAVLLLVVTSFATSFINATIGVGGGVLMLAMLLLVLPAEAVIPVHALIQLVSNIGRTAAYRADVKKNILVSFAPGCLVGSVAAAFILINIPGWLLELVIGLFIVWTLFSDTKKPASNSSKNYFGVGVVTSFVSSFVGATGPLVIAFLHREKLHKQELIGTHGACMTIQHLFKLIAFGVVGLSIVKWFWLVVVLGITGFAGTIVGRKILFALPEKTFLRWFRTGLVLLSVNILFSASLSAAIELKALVLNPSTEFYYSSSAIETVEIQDGLVQKIPKPSVVQSHVP